MKYKTFDEWFNEIEVFSSRSERFFNDVQSCNEFRMISWLHTAWKLGKESASNESD